MKLTKPIIVMVALAALIAPVSAAAPVKGTNLTGSGSTATTAAATIIAAQGSGIRIFVNGVQCKNTGTTTTIVTLNDSASTVLIVPTIGGDNETYITPLSVAANTALTFTPTAGSTTIYCNAQGYTG